MASSVPHPGSGVNGDGPSRYASKVSTNGSSVASGKPSSAYTPPIAIGGKPMKANRQGVTAAFSQFGQPLQASRRPLPTQNGDGTYVEHNVQTGLRQDLKHIRIKGEWPFLPPPT